jgi:hypothetical protein
MTVYEENEEILTAIAKGGTDLTKEQAVDFVHVFEEEAGATKFAEELVEQGFEVEIYGPEDEDDVWEVTGTRDMVPSCEAITQIEQKLEELARTLGGESDGWGLLGE